MSLHDLGARALRLLDAETAHRAAIAGLKAGLGPVDHGPEDPLLQTTVAGLDLPSPIGLAAGFDKNAEAPDAMLRAGFGFVECGTVTPLPQVGNPKPRLFRLDEDRAVINRMGFNNEGLDAFADRLAQRRRRGVVGANIGANKDATDRIGDYVAGLNRLWGSADYFTVNISSPNTPGLRALQTKAALEELLGRLAEARAALPNPAAAPVLLKVAPDLEDGEVETIVETVAAHGLQGIIVSNTTISRPDALRSANRSEAGGLSGPPLMALSTEMLRRFHAANDKGLALIGAGGIRTGADALAKIKAGAQAVQFYSAMVYEGPSMAVRVKRELAARLRAEGFAGVAEAVGVG
ncbi:quinone-dependent dihydroorotate dehydrogenase [Caulobacter mirabilis]|uniref:Dihydroorotate dehydrogenase (quinone) n=1 Tax=Caulobacter mirabilis TaxID=69666 RepID=A0A2D2AUM0_9CAUL|nr:quinone-dependent dihydroorotate dehydrogenase [Caulobacter mirabilis]ATQ41706.1 dihydroorotate dehydrogenase (quinone) [Caulobacter mirabilis]